MFAWATKLIGLIPGIGNILDKLGGKEPHSCEAEKIKAEAELADIKGFHKTGRISAGHFWKYTKSVLAIVLVIYLGAALFFPELADGFDNMLGSVCNGIKQIFEIQM